MPLLLLLLISIAILPHDSTLKCPPDTSGHCRILDIRKVVIMMLVCDYLLRGIRLLVLALSFI